MSWWTNHSTHGIETTQSIQEGVTDAAIVVLAVKPQVVASVLPEIRAAIPSKALVVSIVAGLPCAKLEAGLPEGTRVVRTMPNTPSLVGQAATALAAGAFASRADLEATTQLFDAVGLTVEVPERLLDAVTGLSGSGPAYVFLFIEALQEAATQLGFSPKQARLLSIETMLGAAKLAALSDEPASVLRERVTSKGGTTEAALHVMAERCVKDGIVAGALAANARGTELGLLLGTD